MHATDVYGAADRHRVELWVRSFSPAGIERAHRDAIDRLDELVEAGVLDDYSVRLWSTEVGLSTTAARTDRAQVVLDRVAAFRKWADRRDRTLEPFFGTREATSSVTGETYTAQVLPIRALAEYRGGDLAFVAPSAAGDAMTSVGGRLSALADGTGGREADGTGGGGHDRKGDGDDDRDDPGGERPPTAADGGHPGG